jgi:hypothetical protein
MKSRGMAVCFQKMKLEKRNFEEGRQARVHLPQMR